ncbi:MAG: diaminopimelate decarboxylase family protein, partial [Actinomycetota bacterium]
MPHTLKDVLPVTARVNEVDHLEVGGCDTAELAAEFGTPLYVFDEATFRARAKALREAFPEATLYFAAKAFPTTAVLQLAQQEGYGVDVASGGELHTALAAGIPAERLILHGNNKSDADIARAVGAGIGRIAIDNLDDIDRVAIAADKGGRRQQVLLRVTPGVEAHTHVYIQTGQEDSKFGLSIESGLAEEAARRIAKQPSLELVGVHAHIGSNIFSYDPFGKTVQILFGFLDPLRDIAEFSELNLGGGLGIPYT